MRLKRWYRKSEWLSHKYNIHDFICSENVFEVLLQLNWSPSVKVLHVFFLFYEMILTYSELKLQIGETRNRKIKFNVQHGNMKSFVFFIELSLEMDKVEEKTAMICILKIYVVVYLLLRPCHYIKHKILYSLLPDKYPLPAWNEMMTILDLILKLIFMF